MAREIQCTEVWGGVTACDVSVKLAGLRGECFSRPYRGAEAGGDIHFLSVCGLTILSKIVLADVSGHGEETASISRSIHDALIANIGAHDNSTMLQQVNETFLGRAREGDPVRFTTMVSMILDSRDRSLVYAYAGHPSVLRGHASTGRFAPLEAETRRLSGIPLWILPGTSYEQQTVTLDPGDVLVVYTDAFTEEIGTDGSRPGDEGLARLLESSPTMRPADLKEHVLSAYGAGFADDASLIVLEVL